MTSLPLCFVCREVSEARSSEIKAWAHVQGLNSSLDERNVELRVKVAIEAEAKAQQRLAASEAEIAELRKKLQASKRSILATYSFILYVCYKGHVTRVSCWCAWCHLFICSSLSYC